MKTTKRTFGKLLALALVFLFALTAAVPVFAEPVGETQENLTITIKNNEGLPEMTNGQFTAYQLFTGTPNKETTGAPGGNVTENDWEARNWNNYTLADIAWGKNIDGPNLLLGLKATEDKSTVWPGFFNADGKNIITTYLATEGNTLNSAADLAAFLVGKDNAFLQEFSRFVVEGSATGAAGTGLLKDKTTAATSTVTYDADDPKDDESSIKVDATGYYLIVENGEHEADDAVSEYILAVLGDQVINLKASVPDVNKEIVDSDNNNKGDVAGVGDYVQFKLTGTLPQNYGDFDTYKYIFHDTLSAGLTYVTLDDTHPLTVRVYADKGVADADTNLTGGEVVTLGMDYTVTTSETTDGLSLDISFDDLKALKDGEGTALVTAKSVIVVTYWAKVNENAVIGSEGNPNTVQLEYSNDPNHDSTGKTKEKKVYVYAFGLDLTKVGDDSEHASGLGGAGFVLKDAAGNYAIFKDQYTNADQTEFSDTKTETCTEGPVRRLTGWTSKEGDPSSTTTVAGLIADYKAKKEAFDKASNDARAEGGEAAVALQEAKDKLEAYLLESGTDGAIPDIYGLDECQYYLEEVIVPDGYNTPEEDFDISIEATINDEGELTKVTYKHGTEIVTYLPKVEDYTAGNLGAGESTPETSEAGDRVVRFGSGLLKDDIENQKAPFLPFTGGIGTMIFYVLGTALIAGAITYLVVTTKKRKSAE